MTHQGPVLVPADQAPSMQAYAFAMAQQFQQRLAQPPYHDPRFNGQMHAPQMHGAMRPPPPPGPGDARGAAAGYSDPRVAAAAGMAAGQGTGHGAAAAPHRPVYYEQGAAAAWDHPLGGHGGEPSRAGPAQRPPGAPGGLYQPHGRPGPPATDARLAAATADDHSGFVTGRSDMAAHDGADAMDGARFHCKDCGKSFASLAYRQRHIRFTHRGIKDFTCPLCRSAFTTSSNLYRHVRRQHGEDALDDIKASRRGGQFSPGRGAAAGGHSAAGSESSRNRVGSADEETSVSAGSGEDEDTVAAAGDAAARQAPAASVAGSVVVPAVGAVGLVLPMSAPAPDA